MCITCGIKLFCLSKNPCSKLISCWTQGLDSGSPIPFSQDKLSEAVSHEPPVPSSLIYLLWRQSFHAIMRKRWPREFPLHLQLDRPYLWLCRPTHLWQLNKLNKWKKMYLFDGHAVRRWLPLSRTWSKDLPHSRIRLIRCQWQVWLDWGREKIKPFRL